MAKDKVGQQDRRGSLDVPSVVALVALRKKRDRIYGEKAKAAD